MRLRNHLLQTSPTRVAAPLDRLSNITYSSVALGGSGSTSAIDNPHMDPLSGLPTIKITIPAANTDTQSITFNDLTAIEPLSTDVWFLYVYLPGDPDKYTVNLVMGEDSTLSGTNYRQKSWTGKTIQRRHNVLSTLHVETHIGSSDSGIGTTIYGQFSNNGTATDAAPVRSLRVEVKHNSTQDAESEVRIGSVYRAPAGWSHSIVCWGADDAPVTFQTYAVPIIESFNWRSTLHLTSEYAAGHEERISEDSARLMHVKGHEIWAHSRAHENLKVVGTSSKTDSLNISSDYWAAKGIRTASQFMAWPFGGYDDEAITLAKAAGFKLARSTRQGFINPWAPCINPFNFNAHTMDGMSRWQLATILNGAYLRGESIFMFTHNVTPGGANTDDPSPESAAMYEEHLRWLCEQTAEREATGTLFVKTQTEYFELVGVDPHTDKFYE